MTLFRRPFVLGKTAMRHAPEQDYACRELVQALESQIRCDWRVMQEDRRKAHEDVIWRPIARATQMRLLVLLSIRKEGRRR